MKFSTSLTIAAALLATSAQAYSVPKTSTSTATSSTTSSRRQWLTSATAVVAAPVLAFGLPLTETIAHAAAGTELFNDPQHGFSLSIPSSWTKTVQELADRRCIMVWTDPQDPKTALFIAYTPVRDDFTSLSSFGAVDTVAAQTILPKGEIAGVGGVEAKMLSAVSKKSAYLFDYYQAIANVQPATHFRTIFTLQQGATGGAGAVLVTITLQTPEEQYAAAKPLFDTIIDSYDKSQKV